MVCEVDIAPKFVKVKTELAAVVSPSPIAYSESVTHIKPTFLVYVKDVPICITLPTIKNLYSKLGTA